LNAGDTDGADFRGFNNFYPLESALSVFKRFATTMSLLVDIQTLTERTYHPTGVNFEDFLISRKRFHHLSQVDQRARELPALARVFFRVVGARLYVGLYYSAELIDALEANDPRAGLSEKNITAFRVFIEEINHAVHGALKFMEGQTNIYGENFVRDLELQAKIDAYFLLKYFLAYFNESRQLEGMDRLWLRYHLFECGDADYDSPQLASIYREASCLGEKYTRFVDALPPVERLQEIRRFRRLSYEEKVLYIRLLP
jgi:hypothetical protein